jgi:hypothetical protein
VGDLLQDHVMRLRLARNAEIVDQGVLAESVLRGWLDGALERADDRALFELPGK